MASVLDDWRALDDLRPHPQNYNRHGAPGVIEKMAARIRCNAFTAPAITTPDNLVLGGHLRRLALLKLRADGYSEPEGIRPGWLVPVRVFTGTAVQERAILTGDNPDPADLDYDNEALASLLSELQAEDALEGSGYDETTLNRLIAELNANENGGPPDDFKEFDESIETEHVCPRCGYQWSGGKTVVSSADDGGD